MREHGNRLIRAVVVAAVGSYVSQVAAVTFLGATTTASVRGVLIENGQVIASIDQAFSTPVPLTKLGEPGGRADWHWTVQADGRGIQGEFGVLISGWRGPTGFQPSAWQEFARGEIFAFERLLPGTDPDLLDWDIVVEMHLTLAMKVNPMVHAPGKLQYVAANRSDWENLDSPFGDTIFDSGWRLSGPDGQLAATTMDQREITYFNKDETSIRPGLYEVKTYLRAHLISGYDGSVVPDGQGFVDHYANTALFAEQVVPEPATSILAGPLWIALCSLGRRRS